MPQTTMPTSTTDPPLHPALVELAVAVAIARRRKRQHAATATAAPVPAGRSARPKSASTSARTRIPPTRAPVLAGLHQYMLLLLRAVTARRDARSLAPSPGPVSVPVPPPITTTDADTDTNPVREPDRCNDVSPPPPTATDILQRVLTACRDSSNDPVTTVSQLLATITPRSTTRADTSPVDPDLIDAWLAASVDLEDHATFVPVDTRTAYERRVAELVARVDGLIQSDT